MAAARGEAPGKIILLGEHAAVYGYPALAIPVHARRARATVELAPGGTIELRAEGIGESWRSGAGQSSRLSPLAEAAEATLRFLGAPHTGLLARLSSTIPVACGMGSSAAVSVALVRAIAAALGRSLSAAEVAELVMVSERGFHGNPSGIDAEVISRDKPILFVKGQAAEVITPGASSFQFLVANSGIPSSTASVVGDVSQAYKRNEVRYAAIFREMADLAIAGRAALERGTPRMLGRLMTRAHKLLQDIEVSTAALDALVDAALAAGAAGAKLSGAGRGGHVVAVLDSSSDAAAVRHALVSAGAVDVCVECLDPVAVEAKR